MSQVRVSTTSNIQPPSGLKKMKSLIDLNAALRNTKSPSDKDTKSESDSDSGPNSPHQMDDASVHTTAPSSPTISTRSSSSSPSPESTFVEEKAEKQQVANEDGTESETQPLSEEEQRYVITNLNVIYQDLANKFRKEYAYYVRDNPYMPDENSLMAYFFRAMRAEAQKENKEVNQNMLTAIQSFANIMAISVILEIAILLCKKEYPNYSYIEAGELVVDDFIDAVSTLALKDCYSSFQEVFSRQILSIPELDVNSEATQKLINEFLQSVKNAISNSLQSKHEKIVSKEMGITEHTSLLGSLNRNGLNHPPKSSIVLPSEEQNIQQPDQTLAAPSANKWLKRYGLGILLILLGIAAIAASPFTGGSSIFLGLFSLKLGTLICGGAGLAATVIGAGITGYQYTHPEVSMPNPEMLQYSSVDHASFSSVASDGNDIDCVSTLTPEKEKPTATIVPSLLAPQSPPDNDNSNQHHHLHYQ